MIATLPVEARRCFRLALAGGIATFVAFGFGLMLGHILIVLTLVLLSPPAPPPGAKAGMALIAILGLTSLIGLLLGPVLIYVPMAGVLMALGLVALASVIGSRPGGALIGTLVSMGSTIIAVLAVQSSGLAVSLLLTMMAQIAIAIGIGHFVHAIFPEDSAPVAARPSTAAVQTSEAAWIALRCALIMAPPFIASLVNPGAYLMTLMKGIMLTQQADSASTRTMGRELVGSTAAGGVAAMGFWWLLSLWPSIVLLVLGMILLVLLMARKMYGVVGSRFAASWWNGTMVTAIILVGPSVGDSSGSDDIETQLMVRTVTFLALAIYAAAAVHGFDWIRNRRSALQEYSA
jgi:hypothetical protein